MVLDNVKNTVSIQLCTLHPLTASCILPSNDSSGLLYVCVSGSTPSFPWIRACSNNLCIVATGIFLMHSQQGHSRGPIGLRSGGNEASLTGRIPPPWGSPVSCEHDERGHCHVGTESCARRAVSRSIWHPVLCSTPAGRCQQWRRAEPLCWYNHPTIVQQHHIAYVDRPTTALGNSSRTTFSVEHRACHRLDGGENLDSSAWKQELFSPVANLSISMRPMHPGVPPEVRGRMTRLLSRSQHRRSIP